MSEAKKNRLKAQLECLLVLIIDKRSMSGSKLLDAAERIEGSAFMSDTIQRNFFWGD